MPQNGGSPETVSHISPDTTKKILESHKPAIEAIVGYPVTFRHGQTSLGVEIIKAGTQLRLAGWRLVGLPGCCGVVVSTEAWVTTKHQRKGLNTLLNKVREEIAKANRYGMIICTTISNNIPENKT